MHAFPLLFIAGLGADCSDQKIHKIDTGDDTDAAPLLVVDPLTFDFGDFRAGEGDSVEVTIRNEGTLTLDLYNVTLEGDAGFVLDASGLDRELSPDEETTVAVTFTAQSLEHEGRVVIESSDPAANRSVVELLGHGLIPALYVWPSPYDFGKAEPDCTRDGEIYLKNIGRETLELYSIAQIGDYFEPDFTDITLPLSLEPDETLTLPLSWTPDDYVEYEGELWIDSNAQDPVVNETGQGADGEDYVDEYVQPISGKVDIMFYVDQSCSMDDDKVAMSSKFTDFIEELEDLEADYQVMVVTADDGCHNLQMIDSDTANKDEVFQQAVNGNSGMFTEAGLTISKHAVERSVPGGCNSEFLRESSTVSLVLISDEPEQSPPEHHYTVVLGAILAAAPSTYVSAVAGPLPEGCESGGQTADAGYGYYEATQATGGLFLSICDLDWGEKLSKLAEAATRVKLAEFFYLAEEEVEPNSIHVYVDGEEVFDWTYEDIDAEEDGTGTNYPPLVRFDSDAIPGEGANIRIEYASAVDCEQ
ncbi:MAG TPA: choice-of-anchor D domain-containing protein [Myxococcota bacterium]|nr:choice-of-anchor D domain-containing protein [Myxococcota bacterium]